MESTDKPALDSEPQKAAPPPEADPLAPEPEKTVTEPPPEAPAAAEAEKTVPPPPETKGAAPASPPHYFVLADLVLRFLLFAASLTAVVVIVTSDQTKIILLPFGPVPQPAKWRYSPAFIYFVAALSVAGLYSIITTAFSFLALLKPGCSTKLLAHLVILDVLMLGIVASATGAAGAVAYIGLKGNSRVHWSEICSIYDKFCHHLAASISVSLIATIVLALLIILSTYSLSKKIPR